MDDIKLAMLGNKEAARRLTEAGVLLPCAHCGNDNRNRIGSLFTGTSSNIQGMRKSQEKGSN